MRNRWMAAVLAVTAILFLFGYVAITMNEKATPDEPITEAPEF